MKNIATHTTLLNYILTTHRVVLCAVCTHAPHDMHALPRHKATHTIRIRGNECVDLLVRFLARMDAPMIP